MPLLMKILRWIARFFCTLVIFVLGCYTVVAAAIVVFIVTGRLTPGQEMMFDTTTPSLVGTLAFILVSSLMIAGFAVARHKLSAPSAKPVPPQ